jgi:hypothetical protein
LNAERAGRKLSFNRWLAFSPDGKQLALEEYGSVYLLDRPDFNLDKARQVAIVDEKKSAVYVDGFVGPGRRLLAHNAHRLLTVDLQNGDLQPLGEWPNEHIARAHCHGSRFTALTIPLTEGQRYGDSDKARCRRGNLDGGREDPPFDLPDTYLREGGWVSPVLSPSGERLTLLLNSGGGYPLYDLSARSRLTWVKPSAPLVRLAFSHKDRLLLSVEDPSSRHGYHLTCVNVANGRHLDSLPNITHHPIYVARFSHDDRLAATVTNNYTAIWELASNTLLRRFVSRVSWDRRSRNAFSPDGRYYAMSQGDGSVLVWDLDAVDGPESKPAPTLAGLWDQLGEREAADAYPAVRGLAARGDEAVRFLRTRLKPVPTRPGVEQARRFIKNLDDDDYESRDAATRELEAAGPEVTEFIEAAYADPASVEAEARLTKLRAAARLPEALRNSRAIWVLERIGTPEAQAFLKELAGGAPGARLTSEAKAALARLAERDAPPPHP